MSGLAIGEKTSALLAAQEEVRHLSREAERERIARDLHDLLGRTLTLIALKSDLAAKVVDCDSSRAAAEMRQVAQVAREGLIEVRAAVKGMTASGLVNELESSRNALMSAGIKVIIEGETAESDHPNGAILAMALREAVTNVIRHAEATRCVIRFGKDASTMTLAVEDDGQGGAYREGGGLSGMRARLVSAGGGLRVQALSNGTEVRATLPI